MNEWKLFYRETHERRSHTRKIENSNGDDSDNEAENI